MKNLPTPATTISNLPHQATVEYKGSTHKGDNNFQTLTSLEQAIMEIKKTLSEDTNVVNIIEELADFITENPHRSVIGLEMKLEKGNRQDLKEKAKLYKNRFERRVAKDQMALAEQYVYVQVLAMIRTIWDSKIKPLIDIDASNVSVDSAIFSELIEPVHKAIVRYDALVTSELVSGMLYFLTGKCHLEWK